MGVYISFLRLNSIFPGLPPVSNMFNTTGSEQELPEALPAPGQHQYIKSTSVAVTTAPAPCFIAML